MPEDQGQPTPPAPAPQPDPVGSLEKMKGAFSRGEYEDQRNVIIDRTPVDPPKP